MEYYRTICGRSITRRKKTEVEAKKEMEKIAAMSPDDYKVFMFNEVKKDFPTAKQSEIWVGLYY